MVKTALTGEEKIRAAAARTMYGTTDAEIALILGVTNLGRVNEAIKEVLAPLELTPEGYKKRGEHAKEQRAQGDGGIQTGHAAFGQQNWTQSKV